LQNSNPNRYHPGTNVGVLLNDNPSLGGGSTEACADGQRRQWSSDMWAAPRRIGGDDAVTQSSNGDYIPHHEPFPILQKTVNPHHTRPSDPGLIGTSFWTGPVTNMIWKIFSLLQRRPLPAVSYLKAPAYQDGHAAYSDPLDEQIFLGECPQCSAAEP